MIEEALRLADLGWAVFALGPTGKPYPNCKPCRESCVLPEDYSACPCLLCHAAYAGTTDPNRLTAMWEHLPESLIGLRTGAASGLLVLDFDMHPGGADGKATFRRLAEQDAIPATVSARTPTDGIHLLYRLPNGTAVPNDNRGKLGPACDVKGDGGYVVAAPSQRRDRDRPYRWADGRSPWERPLASLPTPVLGTIARRPETARPDRAVLLAPGDALRRFEEEADVLRFTDQGNRNAVLFRAACRAGEAVAAGELSHGHAVAALEEAARDAGMQGARDGVPGTIRSGLRTGMAGASL